MPLLEDNDQTRLFLYEVYTDYICTARSGVLTILQCLETFKVPIPQMRCLFSVAELQAAGTQARKVPRYPVPGYFGWLQMSESQSEFDPQR